MVGIVFESGSGLVLARPGCWKAPATPARSRPPLARWACHTSERGCCSTASTERSPSHLSGPRRGEAAALSSARPLARSAGRWGISVAAADQRVSVCGAPAVILNKGMSIVVVSALLYRGDGHLLCESRRPLVDHRQPARREPIGSMVRQRASSHRRSIASLPVCSLGPPLCWRLGTT